MVLLPNNIPHLLVIDDEPANLELIRSVFDADFVIHGEKNGRRGLDRIRETDYDVILLDVMLPDIDGFGVLREIRSDPATADLPVILMSALNNARYIVQGLRDGANDYITKPFDLTVVRARVRTQVELKKLSDERKRTIEQLQELHDLREHLFKIASHDLKNPLANLKLAYQELGYMLPDTPDVAALQSIIDVSLNDMQTMIEDFMDAAALQNGKLKVTVDCLDVADSLLYVMSQYENNATRKQIRLEYEPASVLVMADSHRLVQIASNLVSNAIKYSPSHTTVRVWAERLAPERVRLNFADEGPGIPEDERDQLFQEFSKLSPRPTGGESSTGLGLWIVKQLATLLGGRVGADFPDDGGSIFWVELPACDIKAVER